MKKRIIGLLLAASLVITACGSSVTVNMEADNVTEVREEQEVSSEEEQDVSGPQEESSSEEEAFETGGGSPWINSD